MRSGGRKIDKPKVSCFKNVSISKSMETQNQLDIISAWGLGRMIYVQMALRAAIELKVFDIIASSGPTAQLSSDQILSKLPTKSPNTPNTLERILRMLGVSSILTMSSRQCENDKNKTETTYGLTSETRCFVTNNNGVSACPMIMFHSEKEIVECLYMLKDSVLNPEKLPVYKAYHGNAFFEDVSKKPQLNRAFNEMFTFLARGVVDGILKSYNGFVGLTELMDVGGNYGSIIQKIVSVYPHIRGINFDLPHIIANAPKFPGVEHKAGDMFQSIPKAQTIFLKMILHDWNDDQCIKILSNCWAALPDNGKVIAAEFIIPKFLDSTSASVNVVTSDFIMLISQDGKERSLAEFEVLAKTAGFNETKVFPIGPGFYVMEFIKGTAI